MTWNFDLNHDLDLGLSRSNFEKKCRISGMGWPIDIDQERCESIECWTHIVISNFYLTHHLDLGFSKLDILITVSQDREGRLT